MCRMSSLRRIVSLANPEQALDHIRSTIDPHCLASPTALVVWCDDRGRPTEHVHILECDLDAVPSQCAEVLDTLLDEAGRGVGPPPGGLALGLTRPGDEHVQPYDRSWFRALHRFSHRRGLTAYGAYVVTRSGARALHIDDAA
jgi:hypothetical protein